MESQVAEPRRDPLLDRLVSEPQRFELSTAVRLAEATADTVTIVSDASTLLAPTEISAVQGDDNAIRIRSSVPGLVGAYGALPPAYTEIVMQEERRRSKSLSAFLDLFADPLLRLFVGALEKYRLPRLLRWQGLGGGNRIVGALLALTGLRSPRQRALNPAGDEPVLRYAGFFAARTRNASALASMLSSHTGLPVEIEQFCGRWIEVPASEQTAVGSVRNALGVDAMAGAAIRDLAGRFRVVIGPVAYDDYLSLAPGSLRLADIMAVTRLYVGAGLSFDVQIVLRREDVPECRLGSDAGLPTLGWNCWARIAPPEADSRDAVVAATFETVREAS